MNHGIICDFFESLIFEDDMFDYSKNYIVKKLKKHCIQNTFFPDTWVLLYFIEKSNWTFKRTSFTGIPS